MANTEIILGTERLVISDEAMTVAKARQLREAIKKVAEAHDEKIEKEKEPVRKVVKEFAPRLERQKDEFGKEESDFDYEERIRPILKERDKAIDEVKPPNPESQVEELAFSCLKEVAKVVGQEQKVTKERFDAVSWPKLKMQLAKVLISNECDMGMVFLPPKTLN